VERRQLGRSREPLLGCEINVPAEDSAGELHGVLHRCDFENVEKNQRPIRIDLRMGRFLLSEAE
jgi:hypothetical protein